VARVAIETLVKGLVVTGGPEDSRAKATLWHLIEIATGPKTELVGFPQVPGTSHMVCCGPRARYLGAHDHPQRGPYGGWLVLGAIAAVRLKAVTG
jgi:hypothetical protein